MDPVKGNRETVFKVRGITLNYRASQTINFDIMKDLILMGTIPKQARDTDHKVSARGLTAE